METLKPDPTVAVIVPVAGDPRALEALLHELDGLDERPDEIVVVAADGTEPLADACERARARLLESEANRGAQLDTGARAAAADVVWFLHADAALAADSLAAMRARLREGAESGCFRFAFQGQANTTKRIIAWLTNLRVRLGGTAYGDQGLFATRAAYLAVGGFPRQPLFEEPRLVKRLRAHGRFAMLETPIHVATTRWERDGWWLRSLRNRWLAVCYMLGIPAERLAGTYYGAERARGGARS